MHSVNLGMPESDNKCPFARIIEFAQALSGSNLTIEGDGKQTRDFIHVQDVVEGLVAAWQVKRPFTSLLWISVASLLMSEHTPSPVSPLLPARSQKLPAKDRA